MPVNLLAHFYLAGFVGFGYNNHMLTTDEVKKIAVLARIRLTDDEVVKFQRELSTVLDYVEELQQVNIDGVEEVSQVTGLVNVQREDVVVLVDDVTNRIKSQAPEMKDGYYKVKAIL